MGGLNKHIGVFIKFTESMETLTLICLISTKVLHTADIIQQTIMF